MGLKSLNIAGIKFKNNLFLAPMVDVTNSAYRRICKRQGAGVVFSEMIHVEELVNGFNKKNKKLLSKLKFDKEEKPIGIQITARTLKSLELAVPILKKLGFDFVDLNCGCPSLRAIDNGSGSYLLKTPEKIGRMVEILKKAGLIVSVKIRLGYKKNEVLKIAKIIEDAGADFITVHARLANQAYNVSADWNEIKKVKQKLKIPVIGNGDVLTPEDAKAFFKETNADGVMIARAAIGDPTIFSRTLKYLKTGKEQKFDFEKNINSFLEYLEFEEKNDGELKRVKRFGSKFIKNIEGSAKLRDEFMRLKNFNEIKKFVRGLIKFI
jgi:tRNA-dihydrouridine synthase B